MGSSSRHSHTHIDITHISRSPSPGSQDDELHESGVHVSAGVSPEYSDIQPNQSQSGSSSHPGDFVQVLFPNELPEGDGSDSASRLDHRDRPQQYETRSNSARRRLPERQQSTREREPPRGRPRDLQDTSPTESGDSTEEFLARRDLGGHMPRPQSYYGHNGYTHSSSSGSYAYPAVPHSNQVIPLQAQPMAVPYPPQYPQGQPVPYPPHAGYPAGYPHHPPSQVSSPYTSSPYGAPTIVNYSAPPPPGSYFPPQYPPHYPAQQFSPQYVQYPQQMPYPYMEYRVPPPLAPSPQPGSTNASADKLEARNDDDLVKRLKDLMKEDQLAKEAEALEKAKAAGALAEQEGRIREQAQRHAEEKARQDALRAEEEKRIREQALIAAADKARAEAKAAATRAEEERRIREEAILAAEARARADAAAEMERRAAEQRIRDEARLEAIRAYEEKVRAAAEQAAREQQIRKEAAEAALKAAAEEAAARAEKAAAEKKIAEDAAAAARTAAEKEVEAKLKEAEEAAAKAKAEAEEAEKKAAAAAPPDKKSPVRFKDAIGRNYNFPWERCCRWRDMESLINQAFAHIENLAEHVLAGRYDLIGPDKEIIMPGYWESTIEPDMHITMMLWPIPEPAKEDDILIPPDIDADIILDVDDLNHRKDKKPKKKKPSGLAAWMLGGAPSRSSRSLKGDKKPDVAARSQHGASAQEVSNCTVM